MVTFHARCRCSVSRSIKRIIYHTSQIKGQNFVLLATILFLYLYTLQIGKRRLIQLGEALAAYIGLISYKFALSRCPELQRLRCFPQIMSRSAYSGSSTPMTQSTLQKADFSKSPLFLIAPFFFLGTSMVVMKAIIPNTTPLFLAGCRLVPAGMIILLLTVVLKLPQPKTWAA